MNTFIKKLILLPFLWALLYPVYAQKSKFIKVPLEEKHWIFESGKVEFITIDGVKSMKLLAGSGEVVLKSLDFFVGTIEFDIQPFDPVFSSFYFHYKNADENECFYFRTARAGKPLAPDAVQYAPFLKGVNLWDMLPHYQTNAVFNKEEWNRVKLEISKSQMRVYVNSEKPTLEIPYLEGDTERGTIAFDGQMIISKLRISHAETGGIAHAPGPDPTDYDPRYIRNWRVNQPITTPDKVDFSYEFLPKDSTEWEEIQAERRGLINLTRKFGKSENRRLTWLKVTVKSDKAQKRKLDFGFSDEVWVFLNGQMIYMDKNPYNQPMMKEPDGRISVENTSFDMQLIKGYNDLKIAVANNFFGWGIIARLDKMDGIELINDDAVYFFGRKITSLNDKILERYSGSYFMPNGKKLHIEKDENALNVSGDGLPTVQFFPESENTFFLKDANVHMEFTEEGDNQDYIVKIFENGNEVLKYGR
ncbi:MAG: hypothetical protein M3512_08820 [Bacteroidota bacterium]|nr:hypothetical protein [Bacteroidota bacterium]